MTRSARPRDHARDDWFDVAFVRLRLGLREHLRYFSESPDSLLVFVWALLNRDHESGEFIADRRAIMLDTGLSDWRVKRALGWLRHGRGCACAECAALNPHDWTIRRAYVSQVRAAFRSSPPILRLRRDDSEFLAAAKAARQKPRAQLELELAPVEDPAAAPGADWGKLGDNLGITSEGEA